MKEYLFQILQEEHLTDAKAGCDSEKPPRSWLDTAIAPVARHLLEEIAAAGHGGWPPTDTWLTLAEKHLSPLPSSTDSTLSLYDVLRHRMLLGDSREFLVVKGSLSGIQDFIYDIRSAKALKNLRGRSFYLHLLADAVVERLLGAFGLTRAAVLYNSGGTFCLFVPWKEQTDTKFEDIADEIRQRVFACHGRPLMILNAVRASRQTVTDDLSTLLGALQQQKNHDKYAPLTGFSREQCAELFTPRQPAEESSERYIALGGVLPLCEGMAVCTTPLPHRTDGIEPGGLGVCYYPLQRGELRQFAAPCASLMVFNTHDVPPVTAAVRCEYMAGCGAPVQSFEELLGDDSALRRLGILRMDVDNLGLMFRQMGKGRHALLRYAATSRRLDAFFKEELNEVWLDGFGESTVIVYSGGDDLFIAGEWTQTLKLAHAIHSRFAQRFRDVGVGLSGGLSLVTAKYPIVRAAELSADEESLAKSFDYNGHTKDALSLFGIPLRWKVEFEAVQHIGRLMAELVGNHTVDKALISRLLRYHEIARFRKRQITNPRLIWLMDYDLSRLVGRSRNNTEATRFIRQCITDLTTGVTLGGQVTDSPYHSLQLLAVAARLAELKLRTLKQL